MINNNISYKPSSIRSLSFGQGQMLVNQPVTMKVDSFEKSQKTQDKKKMPLWKKIAIGIGSVLAVAGIAIAVVRGKNSAIKNLAEHIDFKKSNSIEEAAEFAKKNFGVKKFEIQDLQIANYVNEGLTRASNRVKGKNIAMPHVITSEKMSEGMQSALTDPLSLKRILNINPEVMSVDDYKAFLSTFKEITFVTSNGQRIKGSIEPLLEQWQKSDFIKRIEMTTGLHNSLISGKRSKFFSIYHELGHFNHKAQNPKLMAQFDTGTGSHIKKGAEQMVGEHLELLDKKGILKGCKKSCGEYCLLHPNEYVADMYGYMLSGYKLSDPMMEVYKKYGGPAIEGICK